MFPVVCVGDSCALLVIYGTSILKLCRWRKVRGPFLLTPPPPSPVSCFGNCLWSRSLSTEGFISVGRFYICRWHWGYVVIFFFEVGLQACSARTHSFLGHLLCGSVRCQTFALSVVGTWMFMLYAGNWRQQISITSDQHNMIETCCCPKYGCLCVRTLLVLAVHYYYSDVMYSPLN
jgi:hypothetical protein